MSVRVREKLAAGIPVPSSSRSTARDTSLHTATDKAADHPRVPRRIPGDLGRPDDDSRTAFTTILFTDIVGHTEMMQRLGDAKGRDVLREHERITRETLKAARRRRGEDDGRRLHGVVRRR